MKAFLYKWMPVNASAHGEEVDQLLVLLHWLMAVLFVGWSIYFIYVLFRFRAGRNPKASYEGSKSRFSTFIEVGVVVAEVILLLVFAIPAWARWVTPHAEEANAVQVRVIGEQYAWNVHYPGEDGVFGRTDINLIDATNPLGLDRSDEFARDDVTTINQLHIPVDRAVSVLLGSKDVIHSFSLPVMRVKQDAIPGMQIPVHFKAVMPTPEAATLSGGCAAEKSCWEIGCAQLCGLGHYRMRGFFEVHSQQGYDDWMAKQVAKLKPAA